MSQESERSSQGVENGINRASLPEAWLGLLASAQQGNSSAVGELINQTRDYLLLVANRDLDNSLRAKVSASDLVQQTMLEASRDIGAFRGASSEEFQRWLVEILRHTLIDTARRYRGTQRRDINREISNLSNADVQLSSNQRTASSIYRRVEADDQLDRAISRLPEHYQQVIQLRHIQGRSWSEVAQRLGISAEAARKLWARTLAKLRDELGSGHE